jgi:hypothetical protein
MTPHRSPAARNRHRSTRPLARVTAALLLALGGFLLLAAPAPAQAATRSSVTGDVSLVRPCPLTDAGTGAVLRFPCPPCPFAAGDIRFPCDPFPCYPFPLYPSATDVVTVTYPCPDL